MREQREEQRTEIINRILNICCEDHIGQASLRPVLEGKTYPELERELERAEEDPTYVPR